MRLLRALGSNFHYLSAGKCTIKYILFTAKSSEEWGKVADHKLRIWHDDVLTQFAMSRQGESMPSRGITNVVQNNLGFRCSVSCTSSFTAVC
jgi:hypothetical protein